MFEELKVLFGGEGEEYELVVVEVGRKEGGRLIHPHPFDIRLTDPLGLSDVPPVISPFSCHLTPNPSLPINPALL